MDHDKPQQARSLEELRDALRAFVAERDWQQVNTPKNLAMALIVEAAELVEHFQWLTPEQSRELDAGRKQQVSREIGDVLIYLVELADAMGIDPLRAAFEKIRINAEKYPVAKGARTR